jgi:two-component system, OmpR family, alkaline phosphatase synthesis response regulator PhoP
MLQSIPSPVSGKASETSKAMNDKILLVEDEEEIQELVAYNLSREGFRVTRTSSGEDALRAIRSDTPDLVVLDLMLPGMDGLEVCRTLKRDVSTRSIPIVMLTAKGGEADIVAGLELGADDYIAKPFSPRIFLARLRAVLRRKKNELPTDDDVIKIHNMVIHPGRHEVTVGDERIALTVTEFRVLHALAKKPGWVLTRYQISNIVHGGEHVVTDRSIDVQIVSLRKKLGSAGDYIETMRGVGYRLKE